MSGFRITAVALGAAFISTFSLGIAQAGWPDDYKAYAAAMQRGDTAAALPAAKAAWEGSRAALKPGENRALLAQNYGELLILTNPALGAEVWQDAVSLGEQGFGLGNYQLGEQKFFLAVSEVLESGGRDRKAVKAADKALKALESPRPRKVQALLTAQMLLARTKVVLGDRGRAQDISDALADDLRSMDPTPLSLLAEVEVTRSMITANTVMRSHGKFVSEGQRQSERRRYVKRVREPALGVREALSRFSPVSSLDSIPGAYSKLSAWEMALVGLVEVNGDSADAQKMERELREIPAGILRFPEGCPEQVTWKKKELVIPNVQGGYIGAMSIGFELNDSGRPENIRVLAEVPETRFTDRVLDDMKRWEADLSNLPPQCRALNIWDIVIFPAL